jgi:hypothetical protein
MCQKYFRDMRKCFQILEIYEEILSKYLIDIKKWSSNIGEMWILYVLPHIEEI